jgi:glycosyltransferase involved in cell wall biosynthesis
MLLMKNIMIKDLPTPLNDKIGFPWTEEGAPQYFDQNLPKITIVTPSFNQGEYIEETIRSVLLQGYPNLEYIIIDGGSTDNTVEIIKKYEPWITYWVSEPDKGQSDAINKGLNLSTGDLFNWLNSDDLLEPNALCVLADAYVKNSEKEVFIGKLLYFGAKIADSVDSMTIYDSVEKTMVFSGMTQQSLFFKTEIFKKFNGVNTVLYFCMDAELWLRYLIDTETTDKIKMIEPVLAKFRVHDLAKSKNRDAHFREWLLIHMSLLSALKTPSKIISNLQILPESDVNYMFEDSIPLSLSKPKVIAYSIEWFLNNLYYHYSIKKQVFLYIHSFLKQPFFRRFYFYTLPFRLIYRKWKMYKASNSNVDTVFTYIYRFNKWNNIESISGEGSTMKQTAIIRRELPAVMSKLSIKTLLDAPCGDLNWIRHVDLKGIEYTGADIVEDLIQINKNYFKNDTTKQFQLLNIITDVLPKADMMLCRDCLVHFSEKNIRDFFQNLKRSDVKYIMTTTFTHHFGFNKHTKTGGWQPLNFEGEPFNFPKPIFMINEGCTEENGAFPDKSLAVWKVADLPSF